MAIAFTFMFIQFANVSSTMAENKGMVSDNVKTEVNISKDIPDQQLKSGDTKLVFVGKEPKFFLKTTNFVKGLKILEGNLSISPNSIVIGYDEAIMMKEEKLFSKVGDSVPNFFSGRTVTVSGILQPTNSALDKYHFVSPDLFNSLSGSSLKI